MRRTDMRRQPSAQDPDARDSAAQGPLTREGFARAFGRLPVFAMLHLGGDSPRERRSTALREAEILRDAGADGVIVENYFGDADDAAAVLAELDGWADDGSGGLVIGLNVLHDTARAFALAAEHRVDFIQVDSVAGHLPPDAEPAFVAQLQAWRRSVPAALFGGVRFKYQPLLSGRAEAEDVRLGAQRADAVVASGEGTGMVTDTAKLQRFRDALGDAPLIVGAGLTPERVAEQLAVADGAVVGSTLKDTGLDTGAVDAGRTREMMAAVRAARAGR